MQDLNARASIDEKKATAAKRKAKRPGGAAALAGILLAFLVTGFSPATGFSPVTIQLDEPYMPSGSGPSFDCDLARSVGEKLICARPQLAALDRQLNYYYQLARERAAKTEFFVGGGEPPDALVWFDRFNDTAWRWREDNCQDGACLRLWYTQRLAVLRWMAESDIGLGDQGVRKVQQLRNGDTIMTFNMVTYIYSVMWSVAANEYVQLPPSCIEIVSHDPFIYKGKAEKAYFPEGGAFFYGTLRNDKHEIIALLPPDFPDDEIQCLSLDEFNKKSKIFENLGRNVTGDEICIVVW